MKTVLSVDVAKNKSMIMLMNSDGEIFRSIKVKNDVDILNMTEVLILMLEDKKEEKNGKI